MSTPKINTTTITFECPVALATEFRNRFDYGSRGRHYVTAIQQYLDRMGSGLALPDSFTYSQNEDFDNE